MLYLLFLIKLTSLPIIKLRFSVAFNQNSIARTTQQYNRNQATIVSIPFYQNQTKHININQTSTKELQKIGFQCINHSKRKNININQTKS